MTGQILKLSDLCRKNCAIDPNLYSIYNVKRGLRDLNGQGVLTGLTEISDVHSFEDVDGKKVPCAGQLYYRGYNIEDIVSGFIREKRFGFEEVTYLLLFGELPSKNDLEHFRTMLASYRILPTSFVRDVIMKAPSRDMMNTLARSVLTLYSYDDHADDIRIENVLRQCLQLIALFPVLSVYGYLVYQYYHGGKSLFIHAPDPGLSTAQNILHTLRPDSQYSDLEARILDIALVLHADHGGGNNSTFTTHVVSSSGTDTYSAIAASLGSLKGPKHGGANSKVVQMFEDLKKCVTNWEDEEEVAHYLRNVLHKKANDHSGLIYGIGHAIYSVSDPRALILKKFVKSLSEEKGLLDEFNLYALVERLAPEVIANERKMYKGVSANVDFYSGFVYRMLDLPPELYTPIFAIARITGWSAHRMEELINASKIIRPAYKCVSSHRIYCPLGDRSSDLG